MAFLYPWGNTQQLNLDWILQKIKELEAGSGGADLDEVAEALIAASYSAQAYDRSDIVFHDGKLYRANHAIPAPGEAWTPAHWDEILLGDTVSNLVQYVAALSNDQIANSSNVSGTHTSDALDTLKNAIDNIPLDSDNISNESQATGDSVTDALDNLNGAITSEATAREYADSTLQGQITANVESSTTASKAYSVGEFLVLNGILYKVASAIASGATITPNTNVIATTMTNESTPKAENYTLSQCTSYGVGPEYRSCGAVKYFFFFAKITDITQDSGTHWIPVATLDNTTKTTRGLIWNTTKSMPVPIRKEVNGVFLEPSNVAVNDVLYGEIVWID